MCSTASRRSIPNWLFACWGKAMEDQELLNLLKLHLPDAGTGEDALLSSLLSDAGALICALTWRPQVPDALKNAQVRLAVLFYTRMGMEGEKEHTEGDVRRSLDDLPEGLRREILSFRRALT